VQYYVRERIILSVSSEFSQQSSYYGNVLGYLEWVERSRLGKKYTVTRHRHITLVWRLKPHTTTAEALFMSQTELM